MVAAIGKNLSNDKEEWQAILYRFKKDEKGWRVFVSISLPEVKRIADRRLEVSGVDSNKDHLAVTETDRFGNLIAFWTIPCCTYGTSSDRSKAIVSEAVKALLTIPLTERSPLLSRSLTFGRRRLLWKKKTSDMRGCFHRSPSVSFSRVIAARAFDAGIEVLEESAAYTSVIGREKFAGAGRGCQVIMLQLRL
ncbi:MAG: hypothetical protein ABR903_01435 [Thermodesulfovibrionales bacterium]|jgi:hypothetical protein